MYALRKVAKRGLFGSRIIDYHPAEIPAKCTDSLASFTLSKLFKVQFDLEAMRKKDKCKYSEDTGRIPRKDYDEHMITFKKVNKAVSKHLNKELAANTFGTFAGIIVCGGSIVLGDNLNLNEPFMLFTTFLSGFVVIMFVPELMLKTYDRLRCLRASILLRDYPDEHEESMDEKRRELHKSNEELNIQYYKASCLGFWHTFGPILSAAAAGLSATNTVNSIHDNRSDFMSHAIMTGVNLHSALEGFDDWDRASRNINYLGWKRNGLVKEFKELDKGLGLDWGKMIHSS